MSARETWLIAINGDAKAGPFDLVQASAIFAQAEPVNIRAGANGVSCLVAYTGSDGPVARLLERMEPQTAASVMQSTSNRIQTRTIGTSP